MTQRKPWTTVKQGTPPVAWDAQRKSYSVFLSGLTADVLQTGTIEVEWEPPVTYVVRIREAGKKQWIAGIETP